MSDQRLIFDEPISSPCISVCILDEQQLCLGCFRSADEIGRWAEMSAVERNQIIDQLAERASQR